MMIKPSNSNFNVHPTFNSAKQSAQMEFHAIAPMYIAYGTIFLVSLFGNSFIIHIIRTDKSMKTAIYYLISNQASVDILITFIYLMDTVRVNSYQGWWFGGNMGNFTCKLCHASFYFLPSFSLFLLVAIAVDRFYAVTRPFDRTPISRHVKKVILTLWIFSLILSALVFANGHLVTKKESYLCHTHIPLKYSNGKELNVISLTLAVVIPMTLLAVLYTKICIKLWSRQAPGEGASQNQRQLQVIVTAKKVTRMMIAIVVLFVICWVPFYVIMALLHLGFVQNKAVRFSVWLSVSFSSINPYVYFAFSAYFRDGLKHLFGNIHIFPPRSERIELQQI